MTRRVFDTFPYLNEADLALVRILSLKDVVDTFVVAEADTTFSGLPHEPTFARDVLAHLPPDLRGRVVYRVVMGMGRGQHPAYSWFKVGEQEIRDTLLGVVGDCNPDEEDLVLISDCDEIPRASMVEDLRAVANPADIFVLGQRLHYYWIDLIWDVDEHFQSARGVPRGPWWWGTRAAAWRTARQHGGFNLRVWQGNRWIADAGWHYSFLGNFRAHVEKLTSWSHDALAFGVHLAETHFRQTRAEGSDWDVTRGKSMRWLGPEQVLDAPGPIGEDLPRWRHLVSPRQRRRVMALWRRTDREVANDWRTNGERNGHP